MIMTAPKWLSKDAKAKWKQLAPQLPNLKDRDVDTLALLCQSWATYFDSQKLIAKQGQTILSAVNGRWFVNPAVNVGNEAWKQILKLSKAFGLSPEPTGTDDADEDEELPL
jgi:P27 family predicted phage terminase small subunit